MKAIKSPVKTAILLSILMLVLFAFTQCEGGATETRTRRLQNQEARRLKAEIAKMQSQPTPRPTPRPTRTRRVEMLLNPGENSGKIYTNGADFKFRFYGTMDMHIYRSELVYDTLRGRSGSYDIRINDNVVDEIKSVVFERPAQAQTPLAFYIEVYDPI